MGLTEKEIVGVWGVATYAEYLDEIVKLTWSMIEWCRGGTTRGLTHVCRQRR